MKIKKEATSYKDIYKYTAPKGYKFYIGVYCFGNVVYESDKFRFIYELVKQNNNY
jgi:hypothetical protein